MQNVQCVNCHKTFRITDTDQAFYDRIKVSAPTHCPDCRAQRRMAYRNERFLYPTKCSLCQKNIISNFSPDKSMPIYCFNCFHSDKWDASKYGQDFDFNKTFFEQFKELQKNTPHLNLIQSKNENCDYVHLVGESKNCYLIFGSIGCEDCYYGTPYFSKSCVDSLSIQNCELCYECITSENLFNCSYCQDCYSSNDLLYCYDCRGCSDCIGCAGLRNKQNYIFNKECSKEEYLEKKAKLNLCDPEKKEYIEKHFNIGKVKHPRKFMIGSKNENVSGNYINSSKNAYICFDTQDTENLKYCAQTTQFKDSYDITNGEYCELCYELSGCFQSNNTNFSNFIWNCNNIDYSESCSFSHDLFGCVAMRKNEYCILNKKYSESEYKSLREKIIEHMKQTKEYGEFFSIKNSPYCYNETVAQEYYPIKKENAQEKKWPWKLKEKKDYQAQKYKVLLDINKVEQDICDNVLACKQCKKNYKIIPQELAFYKRQQLPIPKKCPDCRHLDRMAIRAPRAIWKRECMCTQPIHNHHGQCKNSFETAYPPSGKEMVYCEECYNREIY